MSERWVVNASPLIVFGKIGRLDLLTALPREIVVPQAVANEITVGPETDAARLAKDAYSDKLPEWVRPKTLEAIRYLLQSELIEAGNFEHQDSGNYKFQPVLVPVDEVIRYIEREWDELGRIPNISDICWFIATSPGKQLADDLGLRA